MMQHLNPPRCRRYIILADNGDTGQQAASALASRLLTQFPERAVHIATPDRPEGSKPGYDWNDALMDAKGDLAKAKQLARAIIEAPKFEQVMTEEGEREARLNALVRLKLKDRIGYDQERKRAAKDLGVRATTLDAEVDRLIASMKAQAQEEESSPDIDELADSAAKIIACDDVLALFVQEFSRVIAGEEALAKLTYLGGTSRLLDNPMHIVTKGPSAVGKSATRKWVLKFFPPEDVISFTAVSEKALLYMPDDFAHKILSMAEAYSQDEAKFQDYLLRELMSENKLIYHVPMKGEDGRFHTVPIEKNGPVAFMVTTTRYALNPENETRMLSLEANDSAEQTRKVLDKIAVVEGFNRQPEQSDFERWHAFQRWLKAGECRVLIPWATSLSATILDTKSVRLRRDFSQLLCAVKAHALLHREQRKRSEIGEIVATIKEDYAAVYALMRDLLASTAELKVHKTIMETVKAVENVAGTYVDEGNGTSSHDFPGATVRQIAERLKLDRSAAWRRARNAEHAGYLINLQERKGQPAHYAVNSDELMATVRELLPTPEAVAQHHQEALRMQDSKYQQEMSSGGHPSKNRTTTQRETVTG
jgi:hypothetical protein